ncbi:MAG: T9SS type A sorting domain-containing protein [Ignavibacteriales bacterium]
MKKYLSFFLLVISLLLLCQSHSFGQPLVDKFLKGVYHINNGKDSIQYRLFVPKYSGDSIKYPLVMPLHGGDATGLDNWYHITFRYVLTWAEDSAQKNNPAFVFAPQVPIDNNFKPYCMGTFFPGINAILDSLIAIYPIDTTRLYLTGYSLGAVENWALIYVASRNRFAAAIPMAGVWDFDFPPDPTQTPFWNFHGQNDLSTPVTESRNLIKTIEDKGIKVAHIYSTIGNAGLTNSQLDSLWAAGVNHIYTEYKNAEHQIANSTSDIPIVHRWLFAQKKGTFPVGIKPERPAIPNSNKLYDCYPNPFNPVTNIEFKIANSGLVSLKIFDVLGREIATLLNEEKPAGNYKIQFNGRNLASGVYFYQLKSGDFISTKQLILLK